MESEPTMTPILYSDENPTGALLEDHLEQLLLELAIKQGKEPSRETALVITNIEQALLWQHRRMAKHGKADSPRPATPLGPA